MRITIIGTGALGTSLGLALKAARQDLEIVGHDRRIENAQAAQQRGALDKAEWNLINAVNGADLVFLAVPLAVIEETLRHIGPELRANAVVTDTASVKGQVLAAATRLLPHDVHFVGGHPLVQTRGQGPQTASADLFQKRRYALTPLPQTPSEAVNLVAGVVDLLGAEPLFIDADEHDGLVTAVNQLPTALAVILLKATTEQAGWREMSKMAGAAYADATRLPSEEAPELRELLTANREALQTWLARFQQQLETLQQLLANRDDKALEELLVKMLVTRAKWAENTETDERRALVEEVQQSSSLGSLLFGGFLRKREKKK